MTEQIAGYVITSGIGIVFKALYNIIKKYRGDSLYFVLSDLAAEIIFML